MMIFYAGTWTFPLFYHYTEKFNTLIIFIALAILLFNNINILEKIRAKEKMLIALALTVLIAFANLFIIGSNKGCILILADFLMIWYLGPELEFSEKQKKTLEVFFLIMFASWFVYDRAFSYNSNTGATVTVFTLLGAMILLTKLTSKKEIYGFFIVIAMMRTVTLVLWHLARGAFIALFLFILFYYIVPAKWWEKRKAFTALSVFATVGSLAFVAFYVALASTGFNMQLPFFYKSIFSGREQIWMEVWDILKGSLLTGIGSGRQLKSFFEYNMHNAMYDIFAVHGVIVLAGSLFIILKRLRQIQAGVKHTDQTKICAIAALFAIFIESFIDMDLMWADYSPLLLFLVVEAFGNGKGKV